MIDGTTNYSHARVVNHIIDNSIVEPQVNVPIDFVLFQPYTSPEGLDSKVRKYVYETDFVRQNGAPRMNRDGQHIYNAVQWLKGGATLLGLRVVAENSKPAFGVINIRTKPTTITISASNVDPMTPGMSIVQDKIVGYSGHLYRCSVASTIVPDIIDATYLSTNFFDLGTADVTVSGLKISPSLAPVPASILTPTVLGLSEPLLLKQILVAMNGRPPSVAGWDDHYLTVFKVRGTGAFGNNYGASIQLDQTREEDLQDGRRYFYNIYKKAATGNVTNQATTMSISFNPDAVDPTGTVSEFIDTVTQSEDYVKTFDSIGVYTREDTFNELIETMKPYCGEVLDSSASVTLVEPQDPLFIDFFSLVDRNAQAYVRFLPPDETDLQALEAAGYPDTDFSLTSNFFQGGDEGDLDRELYIVGTAPGGYTGPNKYFSTKSEADAAYNATKNELIRKAYAGLIDSNILSEYKYQISAVIDANNLDDVKKEMIYFCRRRLDVMAYIDCGMVASCQAAINYRKTMLTGLQDWNASVWPQNGVAWDSYNKRNIDVTYAFDLAYKIPFLRVNIGPNKLMAGTTKGAMATMSSLSWYPDEDQKTELLKNQMNYVEEIRLNQYAIMSNRTMYLARLSYLAVIRNCHAICEAIWVGRQILTDLRFEEEPGAAMVKANEQVTRNLQYLKTNGPVERLTVTTVQTQQDAYENSASLYIEMKFTDFIQTWNFYVVAAR